MTKNKSIDVEKIEYAAYEAIRGLPYEVNNALPIFLLASYLDKKAKTLPGILEELKELAGEKDYPNLDTWLITDAYPVIHTFAQKHTEKELLSTIIQFKHNREKNSACVSTPDSINRLALRLLDIDEHSIVLDTCCGEASFLSYINEVTGNTHLYGMEINQSVRVFASIRLKLLTGACHILQGNLLTKGTELPAADAVFVDPPLATRDAALDGYNDPALKEFFKNEKPHTIANWLYIAIGLLHKKSTGKMIAITNGNPLFNSIDKNTREKLFKEYNLESVIALPAKLRSDTNIPLMMLVFGNESRNNITFVDASDLCEFDRNKRAVISDTQIDEIIQRMKTSGDNSTQVDKEKLEQSDFNLYPPMYMNTTKNFSNFVYLKDVCTYIKRGKIINKKYLDTVTTQHDTQYKYLPLRCLNESVDIDYTEITDVNTEDLPALNHYDQKADISFLEDGDFLISRIIPSTIPIRLGIAHVKNEEKVIVDGNLYFFKADPNKINLEYLKAYLQSREAQIHLRNNLTPSVALPSLSMKALQNLEIPIVSKEQEEMIVKQYKSKSMTLKILKRQVAEAQTALSDLFAEVR